MEPPSIFFNLSTSCEDIWSNCIPIVHTNVYIKLRFQKPNLNQLTINSSPWPHEVFPSQKVTLDTTRGVKMMIIPPSNQSVLVSKESNQEQSHINVNFCDTMNMPKRNTGATVSSSTFECMFASKTSMKWSCYIPSVDNNISTSTKISQANEKTTWIPEHWDSTGT